MPSPGPRPQERQRQRQKPKAALRGQNRWMNSERARGGSRSGCRLLTNGGPQRSVWITVQKSPAEGKTCHPKGHVWPLPAPLWQQQQKKRHTALNGSSTASPGGTRPGLSRSVTATSDSGAGDGQGSTVQAEKGKLQNCRRVCLSPFAALPKTSSRKG